MEKKRIISDKSSGSITSGFWRKRKKTSPHQCSSTTQQSKLKKKSCLWSSPNRREESLKRTCCWATGKKKKQELKKAGHFVSVNCPAKPPNIPTNITQPQQLCHCSLELWDPKNVPRNTAITYSTSKTARGKLLPKEDFHLLSTKLTQLASKEGRKNTASISLSIAAGGWLSGCSSYKGHIGVWKIVKEVVTFACLDDMMYCCTFRPMLTLFWSAHYFLLWAQIRHLNFPTAPVAFWQKQFIPPSSEELLPLHIQ